MRLSLREYLSPVWSRRNSRNIQAHYDDLDRCIEVMVDSFPTQGPPEMYSCALWQDPYPFVQASADETPTCFGVINRTYSPGEGPLVSTLTEANKIRLKTLARRLYLEPNMRVLDIGCGDGALAYYLATEHGVQVEGITLSQKQLERAERRARETRGIRFHLMDFADAPKLGAFDRVVSVGMAEHVGIGRLREYANAFRQTMNSDGRGLNHCIYKARDAPEINAWIEKHIFPGAYVPNEADLADAFSSAGLKAEWIHHVPGIHYAKTLDAWRERLDQKWDEIKHHFADPEHQKRIMDFYLAGCAPWFRTGGAAVVQLELVPA